MQKSGFIDCLAHLIYISCLNLLKLNILMLKHVHTKNSIYITNAIYLTLYTLKKFLLLWLLGIFGANEGKLNNALKLR